MDDLPVSHNQMVTSCDHMAGSKSKAQGTQRPRAIVPADWIDRVVMERPGGEAAPKPNPFYPLVNIQKAMENGHRNNGFAH